MTKNTNVAVTVEPAKKTIETCDLSGCTTTSAKIRKLDADGFSRGDIAKFLNKRYQHVRNVLITPVKTPAGSVQTAD